MWWFSKTITVAATSTQGLWSPHSGFWPCLQNQACNPSCGAGLVPNQKVVGCPHNHHATIVPVYTCQQVSVAAYRTQSCVRPLMSFLPLQLIYHLSTLCEQVSRERISWPVELVSLCPSFKVITIFSNMVLPSSYGGLLRVITIACVFLGGRGCLSRLFDQYLIGRCIIPDIFI